MLAVIFAAILGAAAEAPPPAVPPGPPDPRVVPGACITEEFPDLPHNLEGKPSAMMIQIPGDYDPKRWHPVFYWFSGGNGRPDAWCEGRTVTGLERFVLVQLPLYKTDGSVGSSIPVEVGDGPTNWANDKIMLERLAKLVPNLLPTGRVAAGFSNGANTISALLGQNDGVWDRSLGFVALCEGGYTLGDLRVLKGKSLLAVYGENGAKGAMKPMVELAQKTPGVRAEGIEMPGVGHGFPDPQRLRMRDWVWRESVYTDFTPRFSAATTLVQRKKTAEAMPAFAGLKGEVQAHCPTLAARIDEIVAQIEAKANGELVAATKHWPQTPSTRTLTAKRLEKVIETFGGTKVAGEAQASLERLRSEIASDQAGK